jgi:hypothetical protein
MADDCAPLGREALAGLADAIRRRGAVLARLVGRPFPARPGYLIGACGHAVAEAAWLAGRRYCPALSCAPVPAEPELPPAPAEALTLF